VVVVVVVVTVVVVKVYCDIFSDIVSEAEFIALTRTVSAHLGGGTGVPAEVSENSDMIDMNSMKQRI